MRLRRAVVEDADALTELARRSKATWGYPDKWLEEWKPQLQLTAEYIRGNTVFVAESDGELLGVIGIEDGEHGPEIGHLWVSAESQGRGVGRILVDRARQVAEENQWASLSILSDPYAQPFYERLGAVQVGERAAPVAGTERYLPVLRLEI